jgi:hypothetical protein
MSQIQGFTQANLWEIEAATRAGRVTLRDVDYGVLGIYSIGGTNGATQMTAGIAAGSTIFSMRWTHATNLALIRRFTLSMGCGATAFAAGAAQFNFVAARGFTASDTGGTSLKPSANQNKLRTTGMGTSLIGDVRISSTVALTPGTRTPDAQSLASIVAGVPNVAGQQIITPPFAMWDARPGEHPLLLAQDEGVILTCTLPATGTWFFGVKLDIAELAAY